METLQPVRKPCNVRGSVTIQKLQFTASYKCCVVDSQFKLRLQSLLIYRFLLVFFLLLLLVEAVQQCNVGRFCLALLWLIIREYPADSAPLTLSIQ